MLWQLRGSFRASGEVAPNATLWATRLRRGPVVLRSRSRRPRAPEAEASLPAAGGAVLALPGGPVERCYTAAGAGH